MDNRIYCLYVLILALSLASCGRTKEDRTDRANGVIPGEVSALIMGTDYLADTLYSSETATYVHIDNPDYRQHIIYGPDGVLLNSPSVALDSLGVGSYVVRDVLGSVYVDFAMPSSISSLKASYPQYPGFSQINVYGLSTTGQRLAYSYAVAVAKQEMKNHEGINKWLKTCVDDSVKGDPTIKQMGDELMRDFFSQYKTAENQWLYTDTRSILVYEMTDKYLTYEDCFYGFRGGAHGMYAIRFVSYDQENNVPVTFASLFKDDCEEQVRELIFESLAADDDFMSNHKLTSLSQVKSYVSNNLGGDSLPIPDPGLLKDGVIFCYQPYEIGPYSDGALQVIVPYERINELFR